MNHIIKLITVMFTMLLLGCSNTQLTKSNTFNPNQKYIVFEGGKPYRIPNNTTYMPVLHQAGVNKYHYYGFTDCKIGDLAWMEKNMQEESTSAARAKDYEEFKRVDIRAAKANKLGCVPPLSNREYEYYKNLEKEESANRRARMYYNANTAPVTVNHNVQYAGSIDIR